MPFAKRSWPKAATAKRSPAAARKNSKDVTTKLLGGDVGWFRSAGQMDKGFSDVAFGLKVGEISEPVKTEFGWHLILVTDRRDPATAQPPAVPPTDAAATPKPAEEAASTAPAATPNPAAAATAATTPAAPGTTAAPAATPAVAVEAKRTPRSEQANFRLSIETVGSQALRAQQFTFAPEQAVEFNLVLKNESSKEQKFVARELLPLGLKVTPLGETVALPGDFQSIPEPAAYFVAVKPYELLGIEVSLNDYFKGLGKKRYAITWDITTLLATLEARFAKAKESPDWIVFSEAAKKRFPLQVDVVQRDLSPRIVYQRSRPLTVSIAEAAQGGGQVLRSLQALRLRRASRDRALQSEAVRWDALLRLAHHGGLLRRARFLRQPARGLRLGRLPDAHGHGRSQFAAPHDAE
jgi:hypothetical protein